MDRMSTLDAEFYFVERANIPMHIGSVAVFEGPPPAYPDLVRLYAAKLHLVPRYRQVVRTSPLQVFRPYWADDQHFEISYHVRHASCPAPGAAAQLRDLATRVFSQRLDRSRPLWEAWLVEGLEGGRWAIISKIHHCMADGIGGNDLMSVIFDSDPAGRPGEPEPWTPAPPPAPAELLADGMRDAIAWPLRQFAESYGLIWARGGESGWRRIGEGLGDGMMRLAQRSAGFLNGPIGQHRRWAWTTVPMRDVRQARAALGGTINDVVLAAASRGFRDLLDGRGELAPGMVVRTLVPVSVRTETERGLLANRVSAVLVNLPVAVPDPRQRLRLIREQMDRIKGGRQELGAELLNGAIGLAWPGWLALGSRSAFRVPQPMVQTVTTNVPGPRRPLYVLGRQMVALYPYVPIGSRLRTAMAITSYLDTVTFGVTADYLAVPDLDVLLDGIAAGLAELVQPAAAAGPAPGEAAAEPQAPREAAAEAAEPEAPREAAAEAAEPEAPRGTVAEQDAGPAPATAPEPGGETAAKPGADGKITVKPGKSAGKPGKVPVQPGKSTVKPGKAVAKPGKAAMVKPGKAAGKPGAHGKAGSRTRAAR